MGQADTILVAGAGPAGATVARLLALRGRHVTLVDPGRCVTNRLEIVSPSSCGMLEAAGLARLLHDAQMARPCLGIRRQWGSADIAIDDFFRHPGGRGYVVDRARFDQALRALAADSGVERVTGRVAVVHGTRRGMAAIVDTISGRQERLAGLVIDATGRPAAVARRLGVKRLASDRRIAERRSPDGAQDASGQPCWLDVTGVGDGWSYAVTGPDGRREQWMVRRPGRPVPNDARSRVDASAAILSRAAGDGWIAVGDAAASFDPISGQGLANALSTALVAAGAIIAPDGLDDVAGRIYSDAVLATFRHSEIGRARVYGALRLGAQR